MIKLELDVAEVNAVLTGLSLMAYKDVAVLISKIQAQAAPQVQKEEPEKEK